MARPHAAITNRKYFRLLPLVSAVVLLTGLATPFAVFAQSPSQSFFDERSDRQDAERQRVIQEQELAKELNDAETERNFRDNQNELDARLQQQEMDSQADAARRSAEDRANYLKAAESAQAAALAKQASEAEKKQTKDAKAEPVPPPASVIPTSPKQDLTPADSVIGAPATPMTAEEQAVHDAVAAALAKIQADNNIGQPAPAPVEPVATPTAEVAPAPAEPVKKADDSKTPPPPLEKSAKASGKKSPGIDSALADYDTLVQDMLAESLPQHDPATAAAPLTAEDKDNPALSLNSIVMFALDQNPDVDMAEARKQQAIHNVGRAKAALYPQLDLTLAQNYEYNNPAAGTNPVGPNFNPSDRASLVLQQLLYDGEITKNTIKQREQAVTGANFDIDANTKTVLNGAVLQYLNVLKFQSTLRDNYEFIERLKGIKQVITTTYEMGGSAKNDVEYAQSRMSAAESGLENVRSSLNDSLSNLQSLTGPLPEFVAMPPDELDPERVKLDEYVKLAQQYNNDVLTNENDLKQMQFKLKSDKGAYMPRVNLVMSGERTYDDGGLSGRDMNGKATVQMSYNLFDGFEKKENINRTKAMISEIEIKRRKIMDDLRKQLRLSYNQMISLQTNISKTKAEISSSRSLQDLNRQNFEQGTVSLIELIEGEERLNNARTRLHQQETDLYLSAYKLLLQVGVMKKNFFCSEC